MTTNSNSYLCVCLVEETHLASDTLLNLPLLPPDHAFRMVGRQSLVQKETKPLQTVREPVFTLQIRIMGSGGSEACWQVGLFSGSFWDVYDKSTIWQGRLFPNK